MRVNLIALIAAAGLISACASDPDTITAANSDGTQVQAAAQPATPSVDQSGGGSQVAALQPLPEDSMRYFLANVGDRVFFGFDQSDITAQGADILDKQAAWLRSLPNVTVIIDGHADERGTREYNLALGNRRANSVRDYLISQGIGAERIETRSYGKERPVALGQSESAYAQNRRGVTTLVSGFSN